MTGDIHAAGEALKRLVCVLLCKEIDMVLGLMHIKCFMLCVLRCSVQFSV